MSKHKVFTWYDDICFIAQAASNIANHFDGSSNGADNGTDEATKPV